MQVSIVIPTYNQRENVCPLYDVVHSSLADQWRCELIYVDNNSDGAADVIRRICDEDPAVKLLERPGKTGLGSAVVEWFQVAQGDFWVMMDGDLSHRREDLPRMLSALDDADIGGSNCCWRFWLARGTLWLKKSLLPLPTAGMGVPSCRLEKRSPFLACVAGCSASAEGTDISPLTGAPWTG